MTQIWRNLASLQRNVIPALAGLFILLSAVLVNAHEIRPAIVDFTSSPDGQFVLTINFNMEAWLARIGKDHANTADSPNAAKYDRLRELPSAQLSTLFGDGVGDFLKKFELSFDGKSYQSKFLRSEIPGIGDTDLARDSLAIFGGTIDAGIDNVTWQFDLGPSVFRVKGRDEKKASLYVAVGKASDAVAIVSPQPGSAFRNFVDYTAVGFDHIVPKGLDHILFVVGLFLLSTRLRPLLWQITSFTIAHTVTLGLGMAGIISIPANIVEPLIAASIVYVAVENLFMDRLSPWRPVVVFFFGLLHGLGFAGVLKEIGLGTGNFVAGLVGFNVGVELGQLSVIAVCFLAVGFWFGRKDWYHARVTIPGSVLIAIIGGWWFYERVFLV